ncbi:MAG: sugar phosphate isomerase/epimerase family protein [Planctomycetota bacterium]
MSKNRAHSSAKKQSGLSRREFHAATASMAALAFCNQNCAQERKPNPVFEFRYMLASCMYGYQYLREILPEVAKVGATAIDIWPKVHGNQREQIDDLGEEKFAQMLAEYEVQLGCVTQYPLGPFRLQSEMRLAQRLGCTTIVTGGAGPKGLTGKELKSAVGGFIEKLKPHLAVAEETGVTLAIENHANNLIYSPDSLKWLVELRPSSHLAVALAPYHLEQDAAKLAQLIRDLDDGIAVFYAWQHGKGCHQRLPKEEELLQMPGRGALNFQPIVEALVGINYQGWTEIFMHPVPRGIPILETAAQVSAEINRSREYLESYCR